MTEKKNYNGISKIFKIAKIVGVVILILSVVATIVTAHWTSKLEARDYTDQEVKELREEVVNKIEKMDTNVDDINIKLATIEQILVQRFGKPKNIIERIPVHEVD